MNSRTKLLGMLAELGKREREARDPGLKRQRRTRCPDTDALRCQPTTLGKSGWCGVCAVAIDGSTAWLHKDCCSEHRS